MFCNKCGIQLDDSAVFCSKCGQRNVNAGSATTGMPKQIKKESKYRMIGIAAAALVILMAIILYSVVFKSNYQTVIKKYYQAMEDNDVEKMVEIGIPDGIYNKNMSYNSRIKSLYQTEMNETLANYERKYGEGPKITYTIEDKQEIAAEELYDANNELIALGYDVQISQGYIQEISVRVKGQNGSGYEADELLLAKISGKWYVLPY